MLQREKSKQCNHSPAGFGQNGARKAVVGGKKLFLKENAFLVISFFSSLMAVRGEGRGRVRWSSTGRKGEKKGKLCMFCLVRS